MYVCTMCTSTRAVADALPAQPETVIGDSTVERSGICTSVPLLAAQPGLGDGDGLGVGLGVVATVNDCVAGDSSVLPLLVARTVSVYGPLAVVV